MKLIIATTTLMIGATGAMAQGFTGGSVSVENTTFPDVDELGTTTFEGSGEFAVGGGVSVAADISVQAFENIDENATAFAVHGIYAISPDVKAGLFIGRESIEDLDVDNYGGEIAYTSGPVEVQGYLGVADIENTDVTLFGVSGGYSFGNGFSVIGGFDRSDFDDEDFTVSTIEIGAEYALGNGAEFYAKTGQFQIDAFGNSEDENYFTIGAAFNFGPAGGTTFDTRGFFDTFPISAF